VAREGDKPAGFINKYSPSFASQASFGLILMSPDRYERDEREVSRKNLTKKQENLTVKF
jgi:hypothetical protein